MYAGEYSQAGWTQCEPCPGGHSCADAASAPQACAVGFYSADGGECAAFLARKALFMYVCLTNEVYMRRTCTSTYTPTVPVGSGV